MIRDPVARLILQRLLLLLTRMRHCQECIPIDHSCEDHAAAWKRLETDARRELGEPGAN